MIIYDLPALIVIAYTNAVTPSNIQAGFKSTGIYPFNSQIFSDSDFLPGYVTDHDILLPAAGEARTTSNKTPENLLKDQLFGNNEIADGTAANIEQQPSTSLDAAVNPSKQGLEALSSSLFSRSESNVHRQFKFVRFQKLNRAAITKEKGRENESQKS